MLSAAAVVRQFFVLSARQATGCSYHAKAQPKSGSWPLVTGRLVPGLLQAQPYWPPTNPAHAQTAEALKEHRRQLQLAMEAAQQQHCSHTEKQQQWTSQQEYFMNLAFEQVCHTAAVTPAQ